MKGIEMRRSLLTALCGVTITVSACSDGPQGPATLAATVHGPTPVGAVVLEVRARGITGFEGSAATRVFDASPEPDVYRLVVVGETAGELPFGIGVEDRGGEAPSVTVVSAVDGQNRPITALSGYSVRVVR